MLKEFVVVVVEVNIQGKAETRKAECLVVSRASKAIF